MKRECFVISLVMALCGATPASSSATTSARRGKAVAIYAPSPDYPIEARDRHLTGSGIALLQIDQKTGYVISGRMLKSTGQVVLDNAALSAFKRWRFKPGTIRQIRIPIHYTMHGKTYKSSSSP
jgi:TonB family protein